MNDPLSRPRCECCDEVLQELLAMRQTFESFFQRFNTQIVQMRREFSSIMTEKQKVPQINNHSSIDTNESVPSAKGKRKKPDAYSSIAHKTTRYEHTEDIVDDDDETETIDNGGGAACTSNTRRKSKSSSTKSERNIKQESSISFKNNKRSPIDTFLGTKLRVMPTCPFKTDVEFEEWERLLQNDTDQRDRLRRELLQEKFEDPDKFVSQIWKSLLVDEVAQCYTYRGNVRADKKAIKNYNFTAIFRECFIQRFTALDACYFMERTMRIFNYAHDRIRRLNKGRKKLGNVQIEADNSGNQNVKELVKALNEDEVFAESIYTNNE